MESDQKRAFAAVVLSALILFSWQFFFGAKPEAQAPTAQTQNQNQVNNPGKIGYGPVEVKSKPVAADTKPAPIEKREEVVTLSNGGNTFTVKNNLLIGKISNSTSIYSFEETVGEDWPVQILFKNQNGEVFIPTFSSVIRNSDSEVQFTNGSLSFTFSVLDSGNVKVKADNLGSNKLLFKFQAKEKDLGQGKVRSYISYLSEVERAAIGDDSQQDGNLRWAGIDFNYHLFVLNLPTPTAATLRTSEVNPNNFYANMFIELSSGTNNLEFDFLYAKKNYNQLVAMGNGLQLSVDYGFFSIISVPIHKSLQFFYEYIPNYGLAIIFLTILIRLITFPLQYKSIKSMKKMQVIQPELNKLKEKYKDNPQKMQQESMALFKRAGANPISGCFPMLLQMPIFFAFYSVLRESIELVNAPFFGWIRDLSGKDPFYVIPVLMAAAMFLQQKLTPTPSTDPTQKKVMMFMPVIFGVFMLNLPSGLTLYILVSTLFGIGQQLLVFKKMA